MDSALDPLDLVKHSAHIEKPLTPIIDIGDLEKCLQDIAQEAAKLINDDPKQEFLYNNPNGWLQRGLAEKIEIQQTKYIKATQSFSPGASSNSSSISFRAPSTSTTTGESECLAEPWCLLEDFEFPLAVRQINGYIQTWELTPATKFVVIAMDKFENFYPFGERYFVEAHFSKPTPKCPNPLAVAKVYFQINISHLLPSYYPINVTYKFEGYESQFYTMGVNKIHTNKFQRYYIDTILHMKLAFYAELCECRNPLKPLEKRKKSGKLDRLKSI